MKNPLLLSLLFFLCTYFSIGQNVNIPDTNFKNYLLDRTTINTNGDSEIQTTEAKAFTGRIDIKGSGKLESQRVKDLTGLEAFVALTEFNCEYNELTSIDISKNVELLILEASNNELTSLNVTKNTRLEELEFSSNQVETIDVANNTELTKLWCTNNLLSNIDVTKNTRLMLFEIERNQLTTLDISNNVLLISLNCSANALTSIDLSKNTRLTNVYCRNNLLTSLDISKNPKLDDIVCRSNKLTSLDMSKHRFATRLLAFANPGLTCIKVADETDTQRKCSSTRRSGWCVDDIVTFSENCSTAVIEDEEFSKSVTLSPNPTKEYFKISINSIDSIKSVKIYTILGEMIKETSEETINISNLSTGVYWLRIENTSSKIALKRIVKE